MLLDRDREKPDAPISRRRTLAARIVAALRDVVRWKQAERRRICPAQPAACTGEAGVRPDDSGMERDDDRVHGAKNRTRARHSGKP